MKEAREIEKEAEKNQQYTDYQEKYKLGYWNKADELTKKNFIKIPNDITFQACIKNAQTNGKLCGSSYPNQPCQYLAFEAGKDGMGSCWVGSDMNDTTEFGETGGGNKIPIYLTPFGKGSTIREQSLNAIKEHQRKRLEKEIKIANQRLKEMDAYSIALNKKIPFKEAEKIQKKEDEKKEKDKQGEKHAKTQQLNKVLNNYQQKIAQANKNTNQANRQILYHQNRIATDKSQDLVQNYQDLSQLDKKLLTISKEISNNNEKYEINEQVAYILKMVAGIFFVIAIFVIFLIFLNK